MAGTALIFIAAVGCVSFQNRSPICENFYSYAPMYKDTRESPDLYIPCEFFALAEFKKKYNLGLPSDAYTITSSYCELVLPYDEGMNR